MGGRGIFSTLTRLLWFRLETVHSLHKDISLKDRGGIKCAKTYSFKTYSFFVFNYSYCTLTHSKMVDKNTTTENSAKKLP